MKDDARGHLVARHTLYQVSTATDLVEGVYEGAVCVGTLREHGNLGLGTLQDSGGEILMVDGRCFHTRHDGSARECRDDVLSPFAVITRFTRAQAVTLAQCGSLRHLTARFDALRASDNFLFAIRVDGLFEYVRTRATCWMPEEMPSIGAVAASRELELHAVAGTLVGFWTPDYASPFGVPGYHLHFVSRDRKCGGHLRECRGFSLRLQIQREGDFHVAVAATAD